MLNSDALAKGFEIGDGGLHAGDILVDEGARLDLAWRGIWNEILTEGWELIQKLEASLGVKLLNRTTRRVSVTPDGAAYYSRAVAILTEGTNGNGDRFQTRFDDLASAVHDHTPDACLAIVIDAFGSAVGGRLHAVAGNGLAG